MYNSAYFSKRYKIIKKIGTGGMSSVYLCVDKNINKKWAVKKLSESTLFYSNLSSDGSISNPEIELLKSLDYYMFPGISDAFIEDGKICIVTDYIEGQTLSSYLKTNGALPVEVALSYFKELLYALEYLHTRDNPILYLDMKPANIMIRPDGSIRLIDFGIAGSILLKSKSIGSIGYSPPEQYIEGARLSEKSDIFALGMTLYEMLTGKKPDSDLSIQRKKINSMRIAKSIKQLILLCIREDMESRPSINQIKEYLNRRKRREKGALPVAVITCIVSILFIFLVFFAYEKSNRQLKEEYRTEMIKNVSENMENGEYSREAIRIICGYIDGNFLDKESDEKYSYEVARYYFYTEKDYARAKVYFSRLSTDKFPEVNGYIKVCNKMSSFDGNEEKMADLMKAEVEN